MVDFSIPQVQVPNIAGMYQAGQEAGRQNALRAAMEQYGGAAAMGDQNALRALAQYDPEMALDLMSGRQQMDLRERADGRADASHGWEGERHEQSIASGNQAMEIARQRAREAAEAHKVDMTAAQREQALQEIQLIGGFANIGDEAQWDALADQLQLPELKGQFDQKDALVGMAMGVNDALADDDMTEYQRQSLEIERERLEKGNRGSYGLNPIEGMVDGKPVYLQPGSAGDVNVMQFPEGFEPTPGFEKIDLGTEFVYKDKRTGQVLGREPKDVAGEAGQRALGTAQGELAGGAQAQLPQFTQAFAEVDGLITDMLSDPKTIESMTGASVSEGFGGVLPPIWQRDRDFAAKMDRLGGRAFLSARQALKGGGAITDYEGQKAEDAFLGMQRAQSAEEFTSALNAFREHMRRGLSILEEQAGGQAGGGAPAMPSAEGMPEVPPEIMQQLQQSPPGTVIRGQNGEVLQWNGQSLSPL